MQVTEALHDHQQVVLLSQQLMMLEVIDHLQADFILHLLVCIAASIFRIFLRKFLAHCGSTWRLVSFLNDLMTEASKFNAIANWIPLEVEHRVDWLYFDPPIASRQSFPDQTRIVAVANYELVAILNVCILKRNLADSSAEHRIRRLLFSSLITFILACLQLS